MSFRYKHKNITLAKALRKNATPQERRLWYDFLCNYKVRFQRQKAIGNFIVDFYCHQAKLVIEIDGSQHFNSTNAQNDASRSRELESYGLKILRFSNREINQQFRSVCECIDNIVQISLDKDNHAPASLPEGGGTATP